MQYAKIAFLSDKNHLICSEKDKQACLGPADLVSLLVPQVAAAFKISLNLLNFSNMVVFTTLNFGK